MLKVYKFRIWENG